uniref:Putative DNA polymerase theta (Helicase domain only) n=1 Tax=Trypanosoma congolense (strain IL3000) TaxID=1068625 RepID=G0URW0_TRYCI|nr:putative DNA polymerase theta (helicase domain only) [Trypanosoma congolense IL3000]
MRKTMVRLGGFQPPRTLQSGDATDVSDPKRDQVGIVFRDSDGQRHPLPIATTPLSDNITLQQEERVTREKRGRDDVTSALSHAVDDDNAAVLPSSHMGVVRPPSGTVAPSTAEEDSRNSFTALSHRNAVSPVCDVGEEQGDEVNISQEVVQRELEEDMRLSTDVILTPNGSNGKVFLSPTATGAQCSFPHSFSAQQSQPVHEPCATPLCAPPLTPSTDSGFFYDLPTSVRDFYSMRRNINSLYAWQHEVLMRDDVRGGESLVYSLPTSGGKTLVAEISLLRCLLNAEKSCMFVLPFVSLAEEKAESLKTMGDALGFTVDGHYSTQGRFPLPTTQTVFVCTIEKANSLINHMLDEGITERIGTVVVDELHMVGEPRRGPTLELFLTKLLCLSHKVQVIGMSATIPNLPNIAQWLRASCYLGDYRPVPLCHYAVVGGVVLEDCVTVSRNLVESGLTSEAEQLSYLATELEDASVLVFCATRQQTVDTAKFIVRHQKETVREGSIAAELAMRALLEDLKAMDSSDGQLLSELVPHGVAFHHGGLLAEERALVERAFRQRRISVLCCTSTLAAGVNLPARRVIFRTPYIGMEFLSKSSYLQMCGRAGRAGLDDFGETFLFLPRKDIERGRDLMRRDVEACVSHLLEEKGVFERAILECVGIGLIRTLSDARRWLDSIMYHHAAGPMDSGFNTSSSSLEQTMEEILQCILRKLVDGGLMQRTSQPAATDTQQGIISNSSTGAATVARHHTADSTEDDMAVLLTPSPFGACAVRSCFAVEDALIIRAELEKLQQSGLILADDLHLCYFVTPLWEMVECNWAVYRDIMSRLSETRQRIASMVGVDEFYINQRAMGLGDPNGNSSEQMFKTRRFYLALILADLLNEVPMYVVEQRYQCKRGQLQNLMRNASMFSGSITSFCRAMEWFSLEAVLASFVKRLGFGVKPDIVPLMEIRGVQPPRARALWVAGFKSPSAIASCTPMELLQRLKSSNQKENKAIKYFSIRTAVSLIREANVLVQRSIRDKKGELVDMTSSSSYEKMI